MPIDLHSADPEHKVRERVLKRVHSQVATYENKLRALVKYWDAPKMKAQMGTINSQIIQSDPEVQNDFLTNLPRELGSVIWEHLDDPGDRLMLALTCKFNAGMFEELKSVNGQPRMTMKKKPTTTAAKPQGVQKKPRQKPSPKVMRGTDTETMAILRRLQPWMRDEHALCYICMRFVSKKAITDIRDFKEKGGWGGKAFPAVDPVGQKKPTLKMLQIEGRRCPVCSVSKHFQYLANTSSAYKSIDDALKKL